MGACPAAAGCSAADRAVSSAEEFQREGKPDAEGYALAVLAGARLAQGRTDDAAAAIERATGLLAETENLERKLQVTLRAADVAAASGKTEDARRQLREVLDESAALGFVDLRLEASLRLGVVESDAARLEAVAKEASERGFELIAGKAERAGES